MLAEAEIETLLGRLERERETRVSRRKLSDYRPYPKQQEFHSAGAEFRERILIAASQVGKTWAGGFEVAMHATGQYPLVDRPALQPSKAMDHRFRIRRAAPKGHATHMLGPPEDETQWGAYR